MTTTTDTTSNAKQMRLAAAHAARPARAQRTRARPRPQPRPRQEHAAAGAAVAVQAGGGRRAQLAQLVAVGEELGRRGGLAEHGERDPDRLRHRAQSGAVFHAAVAVVAVVRAQMDVGVLIGADASAGAGVGTAIIAARCRDERVRGEGREKGGPRAALAEAVAASQRPRRGGPAVRDRTVAAGAGGGECGP